jgi:hypothetical protein
MTKIWVVFIMTVLVGCGSGVGDQVYEDGTVVRRSRGELVTRLALCDGALRFCEGRCNEGK